jgi:hypothetical protein
MLLFFNITMASSDSNTAVPVPEQPLPGNLVRDITKLALSSNEYPSSRGWVVQCACALYHANTALSSASEQDALKVQTAINFLLAVLVTCSASVQRQLLCMNSVLQILTAKHQAQLEHSYMLATYNAFNEDLQTEVERLGDKDASRCKFHVVAKAHQLRDMVAAIQDKWSNNDINLYCDTTYYEQVIAQLQAE